MFIHKSSFFSETADMLQRVFIPWRAPRCRTAYLNLCNIETGKIFRDVKYNFKQTIQDSHRGPLSISPEDFYVNVKMKPLDPSERLPLVLKIIEWVLKKIFLPLQLLSRASEQEDSYLPSTIFQGAKEGSKVRYYDHGKQEELVLFQLSHKGRARMDFHDFFRIISDKVQEHGQHKFQEDLPADALVIPGVFHLCTPDLKIYSFDQKNFSTSISEEEKNFLLSSKEAPFQCNAWSDENSYTIQVEAAGYDENKLHLFLDGHFIYLAGVRIAETATKSYAEGSPGRPNSQDLWLTLPLNTTPNSMRYSYDRGIWTFTFDLKQEAG